jgi:hypothetical protein
MTILLGEQNVPTGAASRRDGSLSTDARAIFWLIPSPEGYIWGVNPPAKLPSARAESINVAEECQRENNP